MNVSFVKCDLITAELAVTLLLHIGELLIRFPCNHADVLMFNYRACVFMLALFEIGYSIYKRQVCPLFWTLFALSFTFPIIEDHFNILIPYTTWINRGMPDWGCIR